VFDPFFSTKSSKNNYGLGMTFCYNAVEKHGGIMDIESEEGRGTSVLIKLPKEK
jgi:signal transduction histidine kinase